MGAMPKRRTIVYVCPGCSEPVEPGEEYVVAREYEPEPGFSLHMQGGATGTERRFHVGHFRGRLGDHFYELVHHTRSPTAG